MSVEGATPEVRTRWAGITASSAFLVVGAVVIAFVLRDAFVAAHRTIGWVVACSIVALLVDPVVDALNRVMPRALAVVVTLLALLALIAGVVAGLANDLDESLQELRETVPAAAEGLEAQHDALADVGLTKRVETFIDELDERVRRDAVSTATSTLPAYLVTGILMLFLLIYGRRYFDGFVGQFAPERGARIATVGRTAAMRGRRYLLAVLGHSLVNGSLVALLCWLLDLPAEIALGFAVGAFTIIPLIGVLVGGVPAVILAFGLEDWRAGIAVVGLLVTLQAVEVVVVRPAVDARTVRVGPTVAVVVSLLGFELYGTGGAVYGVALAVIGLAALDAVGRERDDGVSSATTRG